MPEPTAPTIPWDELRTQALDATTRSYAPYSNFHVGAAALVDDGRIITGCNVENVSYGLALCAECGLISTLHAGGGGRLLAVVTLSGSGEPCMPCGRCRQLLLEHGGPDCLINGDGVVRTVGEILPGGFDQSRLSAG